MQVCGAEQGGEVGGEGKVRPGGEIALGLS